MNDTKDQILAAIAARSMHQVGRLAGQMIAARPHEKEALWAERDFHLWLAETCAECLEPVPDGPF